MNRQQRRAMEREWTRSQEKRLTQSRQARRDLAVETAQSSRAGDVVRRSLLPGEAGSLSLARPADNPAGLALVEHFDGMAPLRNFLRTAARKEAAWAGIPMPLEGQHLVIEPTWPLADKLKGVFRKPAPEIEETGFEGAKIRNTFWSHTRRQTIVIWEKDGKIEWGVHGLHNHMSQLLETLRSADAWGIEQESNAVHTLGGLLRHRQFKQYLLTGAFAERSKRSGVHYLFRKLRPTIAMVEGKHGMRMLAALCMHPIGYYEGSWAGAMCPTDDVLASLMLMRGDEHMLWRRSNQHPAWSQNAGISS